MSHTFQEIEAVLLSTAIQYTPEGSDPKAVIHQWIHALAYDFPLFAEHQGICKAELIEILTLENLYKDKNSFIKKTFSTLIKPSSKSTFTFIDLFAGIGGMRLGFQQVGGNCVFSSEYETNAQQTYKVNHGELPFGDITKINPKSIPNHDVLLAGFPCQPFSIAGYRQGFEDDKGRGNLFFNIIEILKEKTPPIFLLENVKNLKTHDSGKTFQRICHELANLNYGLKVQVLNAKDFNLHQNRERIFLVGFKNHRKDVESLPIPHPSEKHLTIKEIDQWLDNDAKFDFEFPKKNLIESLLEDFGTLNNSHPIRLNDNTIARFTDPVAPYFQKFDDRSDWLDFIYNGKSGHFEKACGYINSKFSNIDPGNLSDWNERDVWLTDKGYQHIYQWRRKYVRRNKGGVCPTLTANMGTGGHNVPLIVCGELNNGKKLIRKLTPEECLAFQGFHPEYIANFKNVNISNARKYQQAGNSVPVNIINEIAKNIVKLIN